MQAIFLDRDGTIIEDMIYLRTPEGIRFLPYAIQGLKLLKQNSFALFLITNQSGVSRGYLGVKRLLKIHQELELRLMGEKIFFKDIAFCPHHPGERCNCRKPRAGMINRLLKKYPEINLKSSFLIGDRPADIGLGKSLGIKTVLIGTKFFLNLDPDFNAANLLLAAEWIVKQNLTP